MQNPGGPMIHDSLKSFHARGRGALGKGPIALILLEDEVEVASTLRHHLDTGFRTVVAVGSADIEVPADVADRIVRVHHDMTADHALTDVVNGVIRNAPGDWIYYCYNAEYLFFPFCEHRKAGDLTTFATEERRDSILTYVVDLYASDLDKHPSAVALEDAHLDRTGYYALARTAPDRDFLDRQLDFFGGLRWRFEEHVPSNRRRIDRISLFRAQPGLKLRDDHTFNVEEYNTYACPWHHSITGAVCSFRTAKALRRNPGSRHVVTKFLWHNSTEFKWHSRQLMDLGLMEPGQWF